jgi:hypothetical protein
LGFCYEHFLSKSTEWVHRPRADTWNFSPAGGTGWTTTNFKSLDYSFTLFELAVRRNFGFPIFPFGFGKFRHSSLNSIGFFA